MLVKLTSMGLVITKLVQSHQSIVVVVVVVVLVVIVSSGRNNSQDVEVDDKDT